LCLFFTLTAAITTSAQVLQDEKRVIFLKETHVLLDFTTDSSIQRYTPTAEDIDSVDLLLENYLVTAKLKNNKTPQLDDYYRQYVGLYMKGQKLVYVNAFCRKPEYFLQDTYYPKGGGTCYFRALTSRRESIMFSFNAPK
jgi:hypothetical protein